MKKHRSHVQMAAFSVVALLLVASVALWVGCDDQSHVTNVPASQSVLLGPDNVAVQAVMKIQDRSTEALFSRPGVVGTGTGRTADGELAVVVYTEGPVPQSGRVAVATLEKLTTGLTAIPEAIDDVPVVVKVTGKFVVYADPKARYDRPVPIGVSTGHPNITAGTIGCRVKDGSGNVYALSNNHIYADGNNASIGDNELQPGPYDGGQDPEDAIGTLHDYETIKFDGSNNYIDAAIAATTTSYVGTATPSGDGYGTPSATTVSAKIGQKVQKYGRTTGWTHGEVSELNVTVTVCYEGFMVCTKSATFVDQIAVTPGSFSEGGDSGSLIVTDDGKNNPVGLLFAGSSEHTLANPIGYVLNRFNVTVDDGSGGTTPTNNPPTADFTYTTTDLTADFTDQSTDSDGSVVGWNWDFGDGSTSTSQNPSHTYGSDGTYTVTLTVTDDDGATDNTSQSVSVTSGGSGSGITLSVSGYKIRGRQHADLSWSGATGTDVEIYRDGALITTTANDGFYTDNIGAVGGGSYVYKVCETGGSPCSNDATVTF